MVQMSLLKLANRVGGTVDRACGICHRTLRLPTNKLVLVRPPGVPIEWEVDIGGYCAKCKEYRCEQHIATRDGVEANPGLPDIPIVELFCLQCGGAVCFTP